ncbi:MAG TPA: MFS transporter [Kofleriaceae bacterium]
MIRGRIAIVALLTGLNFLNFIDRAVIAAVLAPMKHDLGLSNFEAGLLNSAFLIGYFATCPLFGFRADKATRKGLITLGVLIWSAATVASGLATGFWMLLAARVVVGVGEASFAVLAPTIIDDVTPPERKGSALSTFYLAIPLGYALGYILGGAIAKNWEAMVGPGVLTGWRGAFLVVGGPGVVLALTCLLIAEPKRKLADAKAKLVDGLREIGEIPLFRRAVYGYIVFTASVAGFSYWATDFLLGQFPGKLDVETANRWFGLVLIAGGAIGTYIGGQLANRALRREAVAADEAHDTLANKRAINGLLKICGVGMAIAAPLAALGFLVPGPAAFFALAFLIDIGLFMSTSPIAAACLRSVPAERRASAMAATIFAIHLFGDLWSAAALGVLLDVFEPRVAMLALPIAFAGSSYMWWPRKREAASQVPEARVHAQT